MAITTRAFAVGVSRPSVPKTGATIPAVVMMATVDEPCAVLSAAAMMKGSQILRPALWPRYPSTTSDIPEFCRTFPKAPPQPVIIMIVAAATTA